MTATESIITEFETIGYRLAIVAGRVTGSWCGDGTAPNVDDARARLRTHRSAVIEVLANRDHRPRLEGSELIVPTDCPRRYRWWDDRIPDAERITMCAILKELGASAETHRSYCDTCILDPGQVDVERQPAAGEGRM